MGLLISIVNKEVKEVKWEVWVLITLLACSTNTLIQKSKEEWQREDALLENLKCQECQRTGPKKNMVELMLHNQWIEKLLVYLKDHHQPFTAMLNTEELK